MLFVDVPRIRMKGENKNERNDDDNNNKYGNRKSRRRREQCERECFNFKIWIGR